MMLPTYEERRDTLADVHRALGKDHKTTFLQTRHLWSPEHQRGTLRGFIWSSKVAFVQAYQWATEDFTLVYQLTQDHDFSSYYRAVFRFMPTVSLPKEVGMKITNEPYFSDLVFGVVDMSKFNNK